MATISENLIALGGIKQSIKEAINAKGGNVGDDFRTYAEGISSLSVGKKLHPNKLFNLFQYSKDTSIDASMIDTTDVDSLYSTFYEANNATEINTDGWVITSKVTTMYCVFYRCLKVQHIDCSGWDTSNVTDMSWAFCSCYDLETLNLDGWNFKNVTNYKEIFGVYGSTGTYKLSDIRGSFTNLGNNVSTLTFGNLLNLNNESVQRIINALAAKTSGTNTIQFHANVKARMTDEMKAQLAAKGWTLA